MNSKYLMSQQEKIEYAIDYLQSINLDKSPEALVNNLLTSLEKLDNEYKRICAELDEEEEVADGYHYEEGFNSELYFEGVWFHEVSLAFRKLKSCLKDKDT